MASRERADQEQVADVRTGDQKHAACDNERNAEGRQQSAGAIKGGLPESVELEIARAVGRRIIVFEAPGNPETSACACAMVTPGLSFAKPSIQRASRFSSLYPPESNSSSMEAGTQKPNE